MSGRVANAVAAAWGCAEATLFFLVPDVWLTYVALTRLRAALVAVAWAVAGALAGGLAMVAFGAAEPATAARALDAVPGISPALLATVHAQVDARGLLAVLLGPIGGVPYKIYAVEWGARHGDVLAFALVTIPARAVRFVLAAAITAGLRRALVLVSRGRRVVEVAVLAAFWIAFYAWYFAQFPG